jgi:hypothetical protein
LDIVILRPRGSESVEQMTRQFGNRFRVRRAAIEAWLGYLAEHHPGYADFTWNYDNLSQLPEDGNIFDELNIHEVAGFGGLPEDAGPVEEEGDDTETIDEAAVLNLLIHDSELNQLRGRVSEGAEDASEEQVPLQPAVPHASHQLQMPSIRRTPLDEFNQKYALLSLACPTLFPNGVADFVEPRQRNISYQDYIQHAMKWEDGRFAKHHSFRFIALNTLMRQQARGHSKYYVNKSHGMPLTKQALQQALADPDTPEAQAILNRISRFAGVIKGTRPFWYRRRRECESFAHCLGVPSTFITLSPADLHWQSLYRHMPEYEEWKTLDEPRRMAKSRRLLRETRTSPRGTSTRGTRSSGTSCSRRSSTLPTSGPDTNGKAAAAATRTGSTGSREDHRPTWRHPSRENTSRGFGVTTSLRSTHSQTRVPTRAILCLLTLW